MPAAPITDSVSRKVSGMTEIDFYTPKRALVWIREDCFGINISITSKKLNGGGEALINAGSLHQPDLPRGGYGCWITFRSPGLTASTIIHECTHAGQFISREYKKLHPKTSRLMLDEIEAYITSDLSVELMYRLRKLL